MRTLAEIVKSAAHIQVLARVHIEQRQIDRATAAVPGIIRDIALIEQNGFIELGIKILLHSCIAEVFCPRGKVIHRRLRAVRVVNFYSVALLP